MNNYSKKDLFSQVVTKLFVTLMPLVIHQVYNIVTKIEVYEPQTKTESVCFG